MPAGPRIRGNNSFGFITDNPLTVGAVTFNSAGLSTLPVVSAAHAIITLDPLRQFGEPEIIVVTAHTALATVATITRGAYGTTARSHPQNTVWTHAQVTEDFISILTSGTRPTDPYRGESIFETDTNRFVARSTADVWQQNGLFFDPPACRVTHNTTQSVVNGSWAPLVFNTELYDTDSMHNTVSLTDRITINTAGIYIVTIGCFFFANGTGRRGVAIGTNGSGPTQGSVLVDAVGAVHATLLSHTAPIKLVVGDYVQGLAFQDSGGALNTINSDGMPLFAATWIGRGN